MRAIIRFLVLVFSRTLLFLMIFITAQLNRELLFRPLFVKTIGPIKIEKHLYIDKDFSKEETFLILKASQQWEDKTNHIVTLKTYPNIRASEYLVLKDSQSLIVTKMTVHDTFIEDTEEVTGPILGLHTTRFNHSMIILLPNWDTIEFRATTMHEIGHALGLEHNPRRFTLMYPAADYGAFSITNEDIKSFCLLYFCDPKKLSNK